MLFYFEFAKKKKKNTREKNKTKENFDFQSSNFEEKFLLKKGKNKEKRISL